MIYRARSRKIAQDRASTGATPFRLDGRDALSPRRARRPFASTGATPFRLDGRGALSPRRARRAFASTGAARFRLDGRDALSPRRTRFRLDGVRVVARCVGRSGRWIRACDSGGWRDCDGAKPRQRWHPAGSGAPVHRGVRTQRATSVRHRHLRAFVRSTSSAPMASALTPRYPTRPTASPSSAPAKETAI